MVPRVVRDTKTLHSVAEAYRASGFSLDAAAANRDAQAKVAELLTKLEDAAELAGQRGAWVAEIRAVRRQFELAADR